MKKKVLFSMFALLTVFGLAFAMTSSEFTKQYGSYINTDPATISKTTLTPELYGNIKAACEAYEGLVNDAKKKVINGITDLDAANAHVARLKDANLVYANAIVGDYVMEINTAAANIDKLDKDDYPAIANLKANFESWAPYMDDLAYGVEYDNYVAKLDKVYAKCKAHYDLDQSMKALATLHEEYTLTENDLTGNYDGLTALTDYQYLSNLNDAVNYLTNGTRKLTKITMLTKAERGIIQAMLDAYDEMTAAIAFLNNGNNVFSKSPLTVNNYENDPSNDLVNDFSKVVNVRVALDNAETPGLKYIKQLYTDDVVATKFTDALVAFKAYDEGQLVLEAIDEYQNTDYKTILKKENNVYTYKAQADDYYNQGEGGINKPNGVAAAIVEYKNLYLLNDRNELVNYWNMNTPVAYRYSKCTEVNEAEKTINGYIKNDEDKNLTDSVKQTRGNEIKRKLLTVYRNPLKKLIKDAAERLLESYVNGALTAVYNGGTYNDLTCKKGFVNPKSSSYDPLKHIAVLNEETGALIVKPSVQASYDKALAIGYDEKLSKTNFRYYLFDDDNDVIQYCQTQDEAKAINNNKGVNYRTLGFGFPVVTNYKSTHEMWLTLAAQKEAADYLVEYSALIVTPKDEITVDLQDLACHAIDQYNGVNYYAGKGLSARAKEYIKKIWSDLEDRCNEAINDASGIDKNTEVVLWKGTKASREAVKIPGANSWKAVESYLDSVSNATDTLGVTLGQQNSILLVKKALSGNTAGDKAQLGDLRKNVICYAADGSSKCRATDIVIVNEKNFYFPVDVNTVKKATVVKEFNEYFRPLYVPFKVTEEALKQWIADGYQVKYLNNVLEDEKDNGTVSVVLSWKNKHEGDILVGLKPYIIKAAEAAEAGEYELVVENTQIVKTEEEGQITCASTTADYTFAGNSNAKDIWSMEEYMMTQKGAFSQLNYVTEVNKDGEKVVKSINGYPVRKSTVMPAGRVTLTIDRKNNENIEYVIKNDFDVEDEATAIEGIEIVKPAAESIYSISGVKVNSMSKPGVYVVNGKKVLVK